MASQSDATRKDDPNYESLVQALEEIVRRLEEDGLGLDDAVAAYEEGMRLVQLCNDVLDKAELRVTELAENHRRSARESTVDDT